MASGHTLVFTQFHVACGDVSACCLFSNLLAETLSFCSRFPSETLGLSKPVDEGASFVQKSISLLSLGNFVLGFDALSAPIFATALTGNSARKVFICCALNLYCRQRSKCCRSILFHPAAILRFSRGPSVLLELQGPCKFNGMHVDFRQDLTPLFIRRQPTPVSSRPALP